MVCKSPNYVGLGINRGEFSSARAAHFPYATVARLWTPLCLRLCLLDLSHGFISLSRLAAVGVSLLLTRA